MNCSLEKLASYLNSEDKKILKTQFINDNEFDLVLQKGNFPYDYVNAMSVLDEKMLPSYANFYSKLSETNVSI